METYKYLASPYKPLSTGRPGLQYLCTQVSNICAPRPYKVHAYTRAHAPTASVQTTICWAKMVESINVSEEPAASTFLVKLYTYGPWVRIAVLNHVNINRELHPCIFQRTYGLLQHSTQMVKEDLNFQQKEEGTNKTTRHKRHLFLKFYTLKDHVSRRNRPSV